VISAGVLTLGFLNCKLLLMIVKFHHWNVSTAGCRMEIEQLFRSLLSTGCLPFFVWCRASSGQAVWK
jgi:hypothetical protein